MGTGQAAGRGKRDDLVWAQMAEAVDFLASHAQSNVNRVCFLAWTDDDFDVCNRAVELLPIVHEDPV